MFSEATTLARAADAEPARSLKVRAIVNRRAGTALDLAEEEVRAAIERAFAGKGHHVEVAFVAPNDIEDRIAKAAAGGIDVLIVGGGDGTVRTAARHLLGSDTALGILPLGTLNRLAKDLESPLKLDEALTALASATPSRIDVARVNGSIFLCNSLMGVPLTFSTGRARLRGRPVTERLPKYLSLIRDVLASRRKIAIAVDSGEEQLRLRALSVAVTNNGYDETLPWLQRPRLDQGKLTMYVSHHRNGWGMAMAFLRAVLGLWKDDENVTKIVASRLVVHSGKRKRKLSNDGEIADYDTPLVYEVVPQSLSVLTPRP